MSGFTFRYESLGFGNATVKMSAEEQEVLFYASYIGRNPLEDILEALPEMVYDEYDHCRLHWMSEPGVLQLSIEVREGNAHITVEENDQDTDYCKVKDAQWEKKLETTIPFSHLVNVVVKEAERNLLLHGLVGFSEDWCDHRDVFPMSAYLRLKGLDVICMIDDLQCTSLAMEVEVLQSLLESNKLYGEEGNNKID